MKIQEVTFDDTARLNNARNPYQTDAKRVLCVCSAGMLRSSTAANVIHSRFGYNTRACGIAKYALVPIYDVLFMWADQIVCMGQEHVGVIEQMSNRLGVAADVQCLNLPDEFEWMDEQLQSLIIERYRP